MQNCALCTGFLNNNRIYLCYKHETRSHRDKRKQGGMVWDIVDVVIVEELVKFHVIVQVVVVHLQLMIHVQHVVVVDIRHVQHAEALVK